MASTTVSGPVTSTNGFVGALTGAVTVNVTGNVSGDVTGTVLATTPVNCTTSTLAVTQATHGGRVVTLNRAAGITATLPAATGTGTIYRFVVGTTFTGSGIIKVANATDYFIGLALLTTDTSDAMVGFGAANSGTVATNSDTITMDGTNTGGYAGAMITIQDVGTAIFSVLMVSKASASEATPFSAGV